ncbi:MAG: hypothetical protein KF905_09280 [Flavobacteriales bacterium]|nr:hypothetical protein [Flavobacteriales bacterium]
MLATYTRRIAAELRCTTPTRITIDPIAIIKLLLLTAVVLLWTSRYAYVLREQRPYYFLLPIALVTESIAFVLLTQEKPNVVYYQAYLLAEVLLLLMFAHGVLRKRWSLLFVIGTSILCGILLYSEVRSATGFHILHTKSMLVGWAAITLLFAKLLLDLANNSRRKLWHEQRFWVYLSIFLFLAPAIPYIGLMDLLYKRDPELAGSLYIILHVLFFVRYGCALVAGLMLKHHTADEER